jgi:hypothetical protein
MATRIASRIQVSVTVALLTGTFLFTLSAALPALAQIYKWVDKQGVTHYSNTAPRESAARQSEKMEEWQHDPEAHAARIRATQAAQEDELQQFHDQQQAARTETESQRQQSAQRDAQEAELNRKIKFEQKRLEGLVHEARSQEWNAHIASQLELLAADPETYFEFQMDRAGRLPSLTEDAAALNPPKPQAEPQESTSLGPHVIDPYTGELIPEEGGLGSRGTQYIKSGKGYLNTRSGRFFEIE